VASFLEGRIRFPDIARIVAEAVEAQDFDAPASIGDVLEIDRVTRKATSTMVEASCR
jgi:1-deoxy-D-xylulose-5-phosphate reductoisomerase